MKHYIPEDKEERLIQLNEWFTKTLFSYDIFDDEKWLPIRLNLLKWRTNGFTIYPHHKPFLADFSNQEQSIVYFICNSISEILLCKTESKMAATSQHFEKAALYRDFQKDFGKALTENGNKNELILPIFYLEGDTLKLKCLDNCFIQQIIRERLKL